MLTACGLRGEGMRLNWDEAGSASEWAGGPGGVARASKVWCSCDVKDVAGELWRRSPLV